MTTPEIATEVFTKLTQQRPTGEWEVNNYPEQKEWEATLRLQEPPLPLLELQFQPGEAIPRLTAELTYHDDSGICSLRIMREQMTPIPAKTYGGFHSDSPEYQSSIFNVSASINSPGVDKPAKSLELEFSIFGAGWSLPEISLVYSPSTGRLEFAHIRKDPLFDDYRWWFLVRNLPDPVVALMSFEETIYLNVLHEYVDCELKGISPESYFALERYDERVLMRVAKRLGVAPKELNLIIPRINPDDFICLALTPLPSQLAFDPSLDYSKPEERAPFWRSLLGPFLPEASVNQETVGL